MSARVRVDRSPRRNSSSGSSRMASAGRTSTWPARRGRTSPAHLRQGRHRLRRAVARPICRRCPGRLNFQTDAGRLLPAWRNPAEQVIGKHCREAPGATRRGCLSWPKTSARLRDSTECYGDQGRTSFLPHGLAGGADDARQPILLSTSPDAPNRARNMLIADGEWRDAALSYDRSFYLFDASTLEGARLAWKPCWDREGVERRYWAQVEGRWKSAGLRLAAGPALAARRRTNSNPSNHRRPPGHGRDAHLFDHQARRHPPQPDRRSHEDAGGGRPSRGRFQAAST